MRLSPEPLSAEEFGPFGQVLDPANDPAPKTINAGQCLRHDDLGRAEIDAKGAVGFSVFDAKAQELPLRLELFERHPRGSQAFVPLGPAPYCIVVAPARGEDGAPVVELARAFICEGLAVNLARGVWHHPLIALERRSRFLVVDRVGPGDNLEICELPEPATLLAA